MPLIPVNPDDYPTDFEPLDDSITYRVTVRAFDFNPVPDKNGRDFMKAIFEIIEPVAYAGRRVPDNYIGVPAPITPDMGEGERYQARNSGRRFSQFCKCFDVKSGPDGLNTESALGQSGWVAIENDTWQGRKVVRIKEYLFQS